MAIGHFFDGYTTCVVGTHTHVPTADTRVLENGTAYQTDIGEISNSVIGMNKENSLKKFFKEKDALKHFSIRWRSFFCRSDCWKETTKQV